VNRAVEKLRKFFTKRGVTLTATVIAGAVAANSVQAAPMGLAVTISAMAAKGAAVAATVTTLVKGTLKLMTYVKLKLAIGISAGILLAGGAATVAISQTGGGDKWTPQEIAKQAQDGYAALSSYSDSGTVVAEVSGQTIKTTFNIRLQRPNLYRVDWMQGSDKTPVSKGAVWSAGDGDFITMSVGGREIYPTPQKQQNMQMALATATGVSGQASATIPGTFFKQNWGDALMLVASGRTDLKKEKDETIGGENCHVFSSILDTAKLQAEGKLPGNMGKLGTATSITTLWIGKRDHLIHQTRTSVDSASMTPALLSDAAIKGILEAQNKPATPEAIVSMRTGLEAAMKQAAKIGKVVLTQTHENIVVNQKFSPADFAR
jgi:outer membrane lipoprotein-sorting protein